MKDRGLTPDEVINAGIEAAKNWQPALPVLRIAVFFNEQYILRDSFLKFFKIPRSDERIFLDKIPLYEFDGHEYYRIKDINNQILRH